MSGFVGAIPPEISAQIERRERLLWWDRPKRGFVLRNQDLMLIPFSLVWSGIAFTGFFSSISRVKSITDLEAVLAHSNPMFLLVTTIFAFMGIYLVIGRFFHDAWRRSRQIYAVTDRRVMIASSSKFTSIDMENLGEIENKRSWGGTGSISFGSAGSMFSRRDSGAWSGKPAVPTFEFIRDADRVFALIREQRRKSRETASAS